MSNLNALLVQNLVKIWHCLHELYTGALFPGHIVVPWSVIFAMLELTFLSCWHYVVCTIMYIVLQMAWSHNIVRMGPQSTQFSPFVTWVSSSMQTLWCERMCRGRSPYALRFSGSCVLSDTLCQQLRSRLVSSCWYCRGWSTGFGRSSSPPSSLTSVGDKHGSTAHLCSVLHRSRLRCIHHSPLAPSPGEGIVQDGHAHVQGL